MRILCLSWVYSWLRLCMNQLVIVHVWSGVRYLSSGWAILDRLIKRKRYEWYYCVSMKSLKNYRDVFRVAPVSSWYVLSWIFPDVYPKTNAVWCERGLIEQSLGVDKKWFWSPGENWGRMSVRVQYCELLFWRSDRKDLSAFPKKPSVTTHYPERNKFSGCWEVT